MENKSVYRVSYLFWLLCNHIAHLQNSFHGRCECKIDRNRRIKKKKKLSSNFVLDCPTSWTNSLKRIQGGKLLLVNFFSNFLLWLEKAWQKMANVINWSGTGKQKVMQIHSSGAALPLVSQFLVEPCEVV